MKRDLIILVAVALVAAAGVALFVRSRDSEPSPVEKVEKGVATFPNVREVSCESLADRRFECRVDRPRGGQDLCRVTTDEQERVSRIACSPRQGG